MYCYENVKIWASGKIILNKPSIFDLKVLDDHQELNKYVEEVIKPSHHYFILEDSISSHNNVEGYEKWFTGIILQSSSIFPILINSNNILSEYLPSIVINIFSIIICLFGCLFISKIYKSKLSVDIFDYSERELKKIFCYKSETFNIDENKSFNNFVLGKHYFYLRTISRSIEFRRSMRKIIVALAGIIYIFGFISWKYYNY